MGNLIPINFNGQRVLLTSQLAESYGTDEKRISENFSRNKERYTEGKHYFLLQGEDFRSFKQGTPQFAEYLKYASSSYLWTEKGAWLHAKSLNTDKAWEAYEMLVDDYYRIKEVSLVPQTFAEALRLAADQAELIEKQNQQIALDKPKVEFFDTVADSKDAIEMGEAAKVLKIPNVGRNKLFEILRKNKVLMNNNLPYQKYVDSGYFRVIEQKYTKPDGSTSINIKTLVYQKGLDFIRRIASKQRTPQLT